MKKNYISPEMEVVKVNTSKDVLLIMSGSTDTADHSLAPELPGISDDELFQFIMIH